MFYIFHKDGSFSATSNIETNIEDHNSRGEIVVESSTTYDNKNLPFLKCINNEISLVLPESNISDEAKTIRNNLRSQIDVFLLPAATYKDELVTQDVKDKLIQDSLLLAKWPTTENWPNIPLPTLSDSAQEMIEIPTWPEVK